MVLKNNFSLCLQSNLHLVTSSLGRSITTYGKKTGNRAEQACAGIVFGVRFQVSRHSSAATFLRRARVLPSDMVSWSAMLSGGAAFLGASLVFELLYARSIDKKIMFRICTCNDHLRRRLRSAMITFSLNVVPGGDPFSVHALDIERNSIMVRALIIVVGAFLLATAPLMGFIHAFFPTSISPCAQYARGGAGMAKDKSKRGWKLFWFFMRHPFAVEGEGLGNGAGLAMYSAAESLSYPDGMYDKFHDMFHDKIWQDQLFVRHSAPRAKILSVWRNGKEERRTGESADDGKGIKWIWKPVYATMGLGIDRCKNTDKPPSNAVYMMVEQVMPSFHPCAEWFRISTLWRHEDSAPEFGYSRGALILTGS